MSLSRAILVLAGKPFTINTRINDTINILQSSHRAQHCISDYHWMCCGLVVQWRENNTLAWSLPCGKKAKAPPANIATSSVLALRARHQRFSLISVQCWDLIRCFAHMEQHRGDELCLPSAGVSLVQEDDNQDGSDTITLHCNPLPSDTIHQGFS